MSIVSYMTSYREKVLREDEIRDQTASATMMA